MPALLSRYQARFGLFCGCLHPAAHLPAMRLRTAAALLRRPRFCCARGRGAAGSNPAAPPIFCLAKVETAFILKRYGSWFYILEKKGPVSMISVTSQAGQAIKKFLNEQAISSNVLRIYLASGCNGGALRLVIDGSNPEDALYEYDGLQYAIEKSLEEHLGDVNIALVNEEGEDYFSITSTNPPPLTDFGCSSCSGCA
jgi:Fe-S cluster assembly iron-binding protein IscA